MVYCAGKLIVVNAIDHAFDGFTGVITQHPAWFITPVNPSEVWSIA